MSRNRRAFSLVEVVLALGLISAVFIPLLGMLSVGFSTMKESNVDVKAALIAQKYIAAAQMVPFAKLQASTKYLDYEGTEVPQAEAAFTALIEPGSTDNFLGSANIKNIKVTLTGSGIQTNSPRVFCSTVANIGD
jgi:uncharacterized protein (TIGR02598 family)